MSKTIEERRIKFMDKNNKELLKDLFALRKNKDTLFKRPLVSQKKFLNILNGKDAPYNHHKNLISDLEGIDVSDEFGELTFGEYISNKIQESELTIQEVANNIHLHIEALYDVLDEETLPWNIPVESLKQLCLLLKLPKTEIIERIKSVSIDEKNINSPLLNNYAARSQDGISASKLQDSLYDANLKIAIDREKEKRDQFITLITI
jgi:hypothetical protein